MALDEAVETLSGYASQYGRYAQKQREPSHVDAELVGSLACRVASFLFEGATPAPPRYFWTSSAARPRCSPSNRLEGVDYIDLEALRAETKPAWKGPNFG